MHRRTKVLIQSCPVRRRNWRRAPGGPNYLDGVKRYNTILAVGAVSIALLLSGCGGSDSTGESASTSSSTTSNSSAAAATTESASDTAAAEQDATAVAERIKQPTTTKIVTITEDNDPNNLIGRPNGYVSAAVLYDSNASCDDLGVACGVTVEVWADEAAAQARSDYILGILEEAPALGSEFHTVNGAVLVRVDGKQLKPSQAEAYTDALS
jgi:hypothetical protein